FPIYVRDVAAIPLERVGVYVALVALGAALFSAVAGRIADRVGPVPAVIGAGAVLTLGAGTIALSGRSEVPLALGSFLLGAQIAPNPVLAGALERVLPPARTALGYAGLPLVFALGFGPGRLLSGVLYDADPLLPLPVPLGLLLLALEPERWSAHRGAHVRLYADEGRGRTDEQLDGSGGRAPQARRDLRRSDEGPHDVRHPIPHGVARLPVRDAGRRTDGFHLRRAQHADHVEDRDGRARAPRRVERFQPRTALRRRLRSRASVRDALPAGQHHLVGGIGIRRQCAARQEMPRAADRELP